MKIGITINLGQYENVSIETGDHPDAASCVNELRTAEHQFRDPAVLKYMHRVFGAQS